MVNEYIVLLVLSVAVASFSQILLKKSALRTYPSFVREYLNPWVIFGYGLMLVSTLLTVGAYAGLEYKNGAVIESLGFLMVMILSRLAFGEKITRKKLLGNLLILFGIFVFYL